MNVAVTAGRAVSWPCGLCKLDETRFEHCGNPARRYGSQPRVRSSLENRRRAHCRAPVPVCNLMIHAGARRSAPTTPFCTRTVRKRYRRVRHHPTAVIMKHLDRSSGVVVWKAVTGLAILRPDSRGMRSRSSLGTRRRSPSSSACLEANACFRRPAIDPVNWMNQGTRWTSFICVTTARAATLSALPVRPFGRSGTM